MTPNVAATNATGTDHGSGGLNEDEDAKNRQRIAEVILGLDESCGSAIRDDIESAVDLEHDSGRLEATLDQTSSLHANASRVDNTSQEEEMTAAEEILTKSRRSAQDEEDAKQFASASTSIKETGTGRALKAENDERDKELSREKLQRQEKGRFVRVEAHEVIDEDCHHPLDAVGLVPADPLIHERNAPARDLIPRFPGAFAIYPSNTLSRSNNDEEASDTALDAEIPVLVTAAEVTEDQVARMESEIRRKLLYEEEFDLVRAQLEEEIRGRIMEEALQAPVAEIFSSPSEGKLLSSDNQRQSRRRFFIAFAFLLLGIFLGVVGWRVSERPSGEDPVPTAVAKVDIDSIRRRGKVRCGVLYDTPIIAHRESEDEEYQGMGADLCRAVSVAIFGTTRQAEIKVIGGSREGTFRMLQNGMVDLLTDSVMHNIDRDVYLESVGAGFAFSTPYFYAESKFMGIPDYVDCADNLDGTEGACRHLKVCVNEGSVQDNFLGEVLPANAHVRFYSIQDWIDKWHDGSCNVILASTIWVSEATVRGFGYTGPFKKGVKSFAQGPISLVTTQEDAKWSSLVDVIVNTFITAEAAGIYQGNAKEIVPAVFGNAGPDITNMTAAIISMLGNYGDLYSRAAEDVLPRDGMNVLYNYVPTDSTSMTSTGLLYSLPWGDLTALGPEPSPGQTLGRASHRGFLSCGIRPRPGFAMQEDDGEWAGLDVEMCRAIAAALFLGGRDKVIFVDVDDGEQDLYSLLSADSIDLMTGVRVTLQSTYSEPTTQRCYKFSSPYYYDYDFERGSWGALALMTKDGDSQWSDFVFSVVNALIFAEEKGITQETSMKMPLLSLFGEHLKQSLRDCVAAVGSYAQVYNRTMERFTPREGSPNCLNAALRSPQHFPLSLA